MIKKFDNNIILPYGVNLILDVDIPLGDDYSPEAMQDESIDDILVGQVVRSTKGVCATYARSILPMSFLYGQKIVTTNKMREDIYSAFDNRNDTMYFDFDRLSIGNGMVTPDFLFAHEMGHKFLKYRDTSEAYQEISSFFGISPSNEHLLGEVYSDIVGNIVNFGYLSAEDRKVLAMAGRESQDEPIFHLDTYISPDESEYIKRRVLRSIYRG